MKKIILPDWAKNLFVFFIIIFCSISIVYNKYKDLTNVALYSSKKIKNYQEEIALLMSEKVKLEKKLAALSVVKEDTVFFDTYTLQVLLLILTISFCFYTYNKYSLYVTQSQNFATIKSELHGLNVYSKIRKYNEEMVYKKIADIDERIAELSDKILTQQETSLNIQSQLINALGENPDAINTLTQINTVLNQ